MIKIMPKIIVLPELFASGGEYSFSEITAKTGLTRSNVSHLLQVLCEEQMLEKVQYGNYRRGRRLTRRDQNVSPWKELIHALGVPVRDAGGEAVMSLATAYPVFTCRKSETGILNRMKELASELEGELKIGDIRIVELKSGLFGKSE